MSKWGGTYTVGSSSTRAFPMAIFAKTGGTGDIVFSLNATQTGAAVLRVGTTLSFKGGRPNPSIGAWRPAAPPTPKNLNSRGITRGGYRGLGEMYEFAIPAGALKAGRNVLKLGVHGSGDQGYLSANYIVDAVELVHK
jgi:rhamnogalacturonan endolyase